MRMTLLGSALSVSLLAASIATAQQPQQQAGPSAGEATHTLSNGTNIKLKTQGQISSQTARVGDTLAAVVKGNVKDMTGQVLFPDGSPAVFEVIRSPRGLALSLKSVTALGHTYRIGSTAGSYAAQEGGTRDSDATALRSWAIFQKNERGLGTVSGIKEPAVGGDFVVPPGSEVTFDFGDEAITIVS